MDLERNLSHYISKEPSFKLDKSALIEGSLKRVRNKGEQSEIYQFKIVRSNKVSNLLLKVYSGINSVLLFDSDQAAFVEFSILSHLQQLGFKVPKVYDVKLGSNELLEHSFIIMEKIDGIPIREHLTQLYENGEFAEYRKVWREIITLLVRLHKIDYNDFSKIFKNAVDTRDPQYFLKHDLGGWKEIMGKHPRVLEKFTEVMNWLESQIPKIPLIKYTFIHRDFYLGNLFYSSNNEIVLLDPGVSYVSDFRLDLGYIIMRIQLDQCSYFTCNEFLELYQKISGQPVENITFFEILSLIKDIMIQVVLNKSLLDDSNSLKDLNSFKLLYQICREKFPNLLKLLMEL